MVPNPGIRSRLHRRIFQHLARWRLLLIISLCFFSWIEPSWARVRALLVGVSQYENPRIKPLFGPRNDVTLMWRRLRAFNVAAEDITVLSDGIAEGPDFPHIAALPRSAEIRQQLLRLADSALPDDVVIFHFSGHGTSQQHFPRPGATNIEAEDQVLLPRDAGEYDTDLRATRNGLIDYELGEFLDRIRAKGAFVWAVIDACFAGYSTRDVSDATVRLVPPEDLKIPTATTRGGTPLEQHPLRRITDRKEAGGIAGFFAVDSRTLAIEQPFPSAYEAPLSGTSNTRTIGLFTYHLHRALGEGQAQTYRELSHLLLAAMQRGDAGATFRLPVFDGQLDHALLAGARGAGIRWPAEIAGDELRVKAGTLQGLTLQSQVEVFPEPHGGSKIAVGKLTKTEPLSSTATLEPAATPSALTGQTLVWIAVANPAVQLQFGVARPPPNAASGMIDPLLERAAALASRTGIEVKLSAALVTNAIAWTSVEGDDLLLFSAGARVAAGQSPQPVARHKVESRISEISAEKLGDELWRLARAAHLTRIGIPGFAAGILGRATFNFSIQPRLIPARDGKNPDRPCASIPDSAAALEPGAPLSASDGDVLCVLVSNLEMRDIAVAAFYVDVSGGVYLADSEANNQGCWTLVGARSATLGPQPLGSGIKIITTQQGQQLPLGHEYLVVVAYELSAAALPPAICHLKQPGVSLSVASKSTPRGADALMELLQPDENTRAGLPIPQRGADQPGSLVRTYILDVQ
jgi:hypothetical protein